MVSFADETKISVFGFVGKIAMWNRFKEELKESSIKGIVKYEGGSIILLWGGGGE